MHPAKALAVIFSSFPFIVHTYLFPVNFLFLLPRGHEISHVVLSHLTGCEMGCMDTPCDRKIILCSDWDAEFLGQWWLSANQFTSGTPRHVLVKERDVEYDNVRREGVMPRYMMVSTAYPQASLMSFMGLTEAKSCHWG